MQIIEYSDLPESAAEATDADGQLKLWAGNIAVHVIDVAFLKRMSQSAGVLPFHRASKKVPYVDPSGQLVEPSEPNATKFERFIFDLLPRRRTRLSSNRCPARHLHRSRTLRGTPRTPRRWPGRPSRICIVAGCEQAGAVVDQGVQVEINPRFSLSSVRVGQKDLGKFANRIGPLF